MDIIEAVRELTTLVSKVTTKTSKLETALENLPDIPEPETTDEGKVVSVDSTGKYILSELPSLPIPTPTIADAGKVITVNASGNYILA